MTHTRPIIFKFLMLQSFQYAFSLFYFTNFICLMFSKFEAFSLLPVVNPILAKAPIFVPPGNTRNPEGFLVFSGRIKQEQALVRNGLTKHQINVPDNFKRHGKATRTMPVDVLLTSYLQNQNIPRKLISCLLTLRKQCLQTYFKKELKNFSSQTNCENTIQELGHLFATAQQKTTKFLVRSSQQRKFYEKIVIVLAKIFESHWQLNVPYQRLKRCISQPPFTC